MLAMGAVGSLKEAFSRYLGNHGQAYVPKEKLELGRAMELLRAEGALFGEFGVHLDPYVKTEAEFRRRLRRREPPVSTLMKGYLLLFGKDPITLLGGRP